MRSGAITWWALVPAALSALAEPGASPAHAEEVLNERCLWHRYCCFGPSRISAAELKGAGARVLGSNRLNVLMQDSQKFMAAHGIKAGNWRDHAVWIYRGPRSFNPPLTPHSPADWAKPEFDDSDWARLDHPFQGSPAPRLTNMAFGQFDESVDMMLLAAFYRTSFVVGDPAAAGKLTVRLAYAGGARVLVSDWALKLEDCLDLAPLAAADGSLGVLVSTGARPFFLTWSASKSWQKTELPAAEGEARKVAGEPSACIVADLDNDGFPEVLQPHEDGALLWRRKGRVGGAARSRPSPSSPRWSWSRGRHQLLIRRLRLGAWQAREEWTETSWFAPRAIWGQRAVASVGVSR